MVIRYFAHVAKPFEGLWAGQSGILALGVIIALTGLVAQHVRVTYGAVRIRHVARPIAALCAIAMVTVLAPASSSAQAIPTPRGLPDLISDPPFIWYERDLYNPAGELIHVVTFDGMLHNIGEGSLDLFGNPQVAGGVKQRVFDGADWVEVGAPTVRFETDDGHNHFHLISAAQYTLWSDDQTEEITDGSKIGFCLVDTVQVEQRYESVYDIDTIKYCNQNEPDATELSMGITPGWQDVYESSITLQWIDVSDISPGRYWIGAITDPFGEIVESDEDNNGLVFSRNKWEVSGYVARTLDLQRPGEIVLKSDVYGAVGRRAYVIAQGPSHGALSVPTGFDMLGDTVTYVAEPGYEGTDSFSYYAHDTNSAFPYEPRLVEVDIRVDGDQAGTDEESDAGFGPDSRIVGPGDTVPAIRFEWVSAQLSIDGADPGDGVRWFAKSLPSGLTLDETTGLLEGEVTVPGDTTSTIVATRHGDRISTTIDWTIATAENLPLRRPNDMSIPASRRDILFGTGGAGRDYAATGLPEGTFITPGQPFITGDPEEIGDFEVVVDERRDGEIVDSVSFTLTIRPNTEPAFPL